MSAMVYWLLVPRGLSGNPPQRAPPTPRGLWSTSIPTLNQTQPAKNSRPVLFQAGVALRPHPPSTKMRTADYEGRGWRGFPHHASLCIAAYGFLVAERVRIPPSGSAGPKLKAIDLPA